MASTEYRGNEAGDPKHKIPLKFTLSQRGLTPLTEQTQVQKANDDEAIYFCGKFDKEFHDCKLESGSSSAVICDICKTYYHKKCSGLSDELFKLVKKFGTQGSHEIPWHCKVCKKYANSLMGEMVDLRRRQDNLEKEVNQMKDKLNSLAEGNLNISHNDQSLHKAVKEVLEQDKRQMNIVISNIPEVTRSSTSRAVLKAVKDLFQGKLDVNANEVEKADIIPTEKLNFVKVQMKTKKARRTVLVNAKMMDT